MNLKSIALVFFSLTVVSVAAMGGNGPGKAAISSSHELATGAGTEILDKGGNAFDAAVAVSAALAVVEPESSGAGGGGFWLLHRAADDHSVMVDGRETAPAAASEDMYLDEEGEVDRDRAINGALAGGIPGAPAAWAHIADEYGTLPLSELLAPAIRLADEGFPVDAKYQALLNFRAHVMMRWPETAAIFMPDGDVPAIGDTIRNPDLADTLRALAEKGPDGFYRGEVANRLVEGVRAAGGIWTLEDFAGYEVVEREPVRTSYRGYELVTAAPPSSGGIAIGQMLEIVEPFDLAGMDRADRVHLLAEAMRRAYRDRALYLGDPDFVDIPAEMLLSEDYAAGLRTTLRMDRATPSSMLAADPDRLGSESTDTTHFSLIDGEGNMVSATLTVNLPFGAAYAPPGTGVLVNNEMDDFSAKPGEPNAYGLIGFSANAIEPHKRMLSSMSPTMVIGDDRTAVLGTPGGSRIITMVMLGILDFIEGNGPESWVSLPRFHHQYLPDEISIEPDALSEAEIEMLEEKGHEVTVRNRTWGNMHAVMWDRDTGELQAASDPRWESGGAVIVELD
ncbi:gamma-glutamyltransferase [Wenzhouxiangella sp. EGI_FJ10305]|uniref:gamma-glutamyltransferase n=1 Tax=Wenzhouxiangella sp. EGI_FJ10305 TaxID=3243768 RepID=UPI0035E008CC